MKVAATKTKKWLFGLSSCLVVVFALMPAATARADTFPYFKEYGGDVSAGAWFNGGATGGCVTSNYQYPGYSGSGGTSPLTGGILTHAKTGGVASGGASSQYGAFALGNIDTSSGGANSGFYSGGSQPGGAVDRLSFANIGLLPNASGGDLGGGGQPPDQCIPDYYNAYYPQDPADATTLPCTGIPADLTTSAVYTVTSSSCPDQLVGDKAFNLTQSDTVTVHPGVKVTIIVKGNAYLGHSVLYSSHGVADTPKFLLIVLGNIYFGPGAAHNVGGIVETADEFDGWYIAQPDNTPPDTFDTTGEIVTCADRSSSDPDPSSDFLIANCGSTLLIKGALTAKHISFTRINGTVDNASTNEDSTASGNCEDVVSNDNHLYSYPFTPGDNLTSNACSNISEIINYTPDMVVGGGFNNPNSTSSASVEKLVSLPPVF